MIDPFEHEQLQVALRLLQLDGDSEVWNKVAADLRSLHVNVPFEVSDRVLGIQSAFKEMEYNERLIVQHMREREECKERLATSRAELLVALAKFLEAESRSG